MFKEIKKISVIGAGVMGAQIAAHLANCGFKTLLLDILPPEDAGANKTNALWRNKIAINALQKLRKSRPPAFFTERVQDLITPGNIEDHLDDACRSNWIIEAVPEKLEIKEKLYTKLEEKLDKGTIITSNTSGISLSLLMKNRGEQFRKSFLITHFFNPVRYMKLVELIGGPETSKDYLAAIEHFLTEILGKGVVVAKDTPGFIANRIGVYTVMNTINKTFEKGWPIDLVDEVMGPPVNFPRTAMFRTADLVGLDTLSFVAKNTYELCPDDPFRKTLVPPPAVESMIKDGRFGNKTGSGFYKKDAGNILVFDMLRQEYREKASYEFDSIRKAKKIDDPVDRIRFVFSSGDEAANMAKELLLDSILYAASVAREISNSVVDVDNAMKWGYNWGLGPFEIFDAIGFESAGGRKVALIEEIKNGGNSGFYIRRGKDVLYYDFTSSGYKKFEGSEDIISVKSAKSLKASIRENAGASLIELGEGVICCEFHSKMNAIDPDTIAMMSDGLDLLDAGKYSGLLIYNDGADFSVGANLLMIAMAIGSGNWGQIEDLVKAFQDVGMRMRYSPRPVVAAPFGRTLGGGCEVCLAAGNVITAAETYMGLVELGVGLIPAGGGCKNMLLKMGERRKKKFDPKNQIWFAPADGGPFPKVVDAFETIAMAKVSASGLDAIGLGYLSDGTKVVIDRERLLKEARHFILELTRDYVPPSKVDDIWLPGRGGERALAGRLKDLRELGSITDYDVVLATHLAHVLCGGNVPTNHLATEQDVLDLEREVFLKLCGMKETAARIQYMLTVGKPLRN